jgi:hypothetical protein
MLKKVGGGEGSQGRMAYKYIASGGLPVFCTRTKDGPEQECRVRVISVNFVTIRLALFPTIPPELKVLLVAFGLRIAFHTGAKSKRRN